LDESRTFRRIHDPWSSLSSFIGKVLHSVSVSFDDQTVPNTPVDEGSQPSGLVAPGRQGMWLQKSL
jgi:hypothetical protein